MMRYTLLAAGILIVLSGFRLRSVRKLTVDSAAAWGILGTLLIIAGAVSPFSDWIKKLPEEAGLLILFVSFLLREFYVSRQLSELRMKNQELAILVSLLLRENERILAELDERVQKDSVCCQYVGARGGGDGSSGASGPDRR